MPNESILGLLNTKLANNPRIVITENSKAKYKELLFFHFRKKYNDNIEGNTTAPILSLKNLSFIINNPFQFFLLFYLLKIFISNYSFQRSCVCLNYSCE